MSYDFIHKDSMESAPYSNDITIPPIFLNKFPTNSLKPIDYVLYFRSAIDPANETVHDKAQKKLRTAFFKKLSRRLRHDKIFDDENAIEWQNISFRTKTESNNYEYIENFVILSFPTDVLLRQAQELRFYFSLRKIEKVNDSLRKPVSTLLNKVLFI